MTERDERASLIVTVDGQPWLLVSTFADSGPDDRVFTVTETADGGSLLEFGDGVQGAQPPAGSTIGVTYLTGGGAGGNSVTVSTKRFASDAMPDEALWVGIRNRTRAISFEFSERRLVGGF